MGSDLVPGLGAGPFDCTPGPSADVFVFDDLPNEVGKLQHMLRALGLTCQVADRLSDIRASIMAIKSKNRPAPRLLVVDLWWNFSNQSFAVLGRPDIPVPREQHLRGLVMLRDVLVQDSSLQGVPALILSSFLDDYSDDYLNGLIALRRSGIVVETLSKPSLGDDDALEKIVHKLDRLNVMMNLPEPRSVSGDVRVNITATTITRAFSVLSRSLNVDQNEIVDSWGWNAETASDFENEVAFEKLRTCFRILLAVKTIFGESQMGSVICDLDVLIPGVMLREAMTRYYVRSLQLVRAELERRVGGEI